MKMDGLTSCILFPSAKPAQQLQTHNGEHKSVTGEWSAELQSALRKVYVGVSISGAVSAQGIHDNTIMKIFNRITDHFIDHKISKIKCNLIV